MASLAEQLAAARRQRFVGRNEECALFHNAVTADVFPFYVLHIYGPGGVGKTTLLREFAHIASQNNIRSCYLDGRNIDPTPVGFTEALRLLTGGTPDQTPAQWLRNAGQRGVLLIDTYERLETLDGWLRDHFLPQLPEDVVVVFAGRNPPHLAWRTDPGWQALVHVLALRNLAPDDSRAFLTKQRVPIQQHATVLSFTRGHPLALTLVAEQFAQTPDTHFHAEGAQNIVKTLLEQFLEQTPTPQHRAALEACALVRQITEPLLATLMDVEDVHPYFQWLRGRSFVDAHQHGLFVHDLARDALLADLRWRNPQQYADLHRRARNYYMLQIDESTHTAQRRLLFDYIFLHRDNPIVRPYFEWDEAGIITDILRPLDANRVGEIVQKHEGEEAAQLAAYWMEHNPTQLSVFRDGKDRIQGLLVRVPLDRTTEAERSADPALAAAWRTLQQQAPLRAGERATYFRFWMSHSDYQNVSSVQSRIFLNMVQHYLTTRGLAYTFIPCAQPEFWEQMFAHVDLRRIESADFTMNGRRFGVFGHDWRSVPPLAWLALMAEREIAMTATATRPPETVPLVVLSADDFATAVRNVLKHFTEADALLDNPLLHSRLVADAMLRRDNSKNGLTTLLDLVREAVEALRATPRTMKFYRALYHTYFQPAGTQEKASELLDLPYSTYRRHLRAGTDHVIQHLWKEETGQ